MELSGSKQTLVLSCLTNATVVQAHQDPKTGTIPLLDDCEPTNSIVLVSCGPALCLRGGQDSDDSESEPESDTPKRKHKLSVSTKPRKRQNKVKAKGKVKAVDPGSDSEFGIRVMAESTKRHGGGILIDEIIHIKPVPESWDVPPSSNRVAYCQDSFTGPTGARAERGLAKVIILDNDSDIPVPCCRSILTCSGCYKCTLAAADFLDDCRRWDVTDAPHVPISGPIMDAKTAEAESVAAVTSAGQAILRKFSTRSVGKTYFVGCAKWKHGDSDLMSKCHCFTEIPAAVCKSILVKLFRGEALDDDDDDTHVLVGTCMQIKHPSNLLKKSICPRNHFQNGLHIVAQLTKHQCNAQLSILVPIDKHDLRAVIIPAAGIPHTHPSFPRTKIPSAMKQKYQQCIDATGGVGATTLRIDKSSSTLLILDGKLLQDLHPGMIISRKHRDMVKETCQASFPDGTGLPAVYLESDKEQSRDINETSTTDISTLLQHARMARTLLSQLTQSLRYTVIGRVWSNGASRGAFVMTCIVHFNRILTRSARGVFSLKAYISESDLKYLLSFPSLCSDEKIQAYYTFCADSTIAKVQTLRRDTNPIKGSHAQDNQVNSTRFPLLEAIILAKKLDSDTAQVIKAAMVSGVLENPHNSLETRYKSQSQCKAHGWGKQLELQSLTGREAKKLQDRARSASNTAEAASCWSLKTELLLMWSIPTYEWWNLEIGSHASQAGPGIHVKMTNPDKGIEQAAGFSLTLIDLLD
ncbi:hypothetical protein C8R43DRAFT_965548 [Mycena crocata]|nr:hypothetical protein C8R43DRAFT_965548 [Mycena crocata]